MQVKMLNDVYMYMRLLKIAFSSSTNALDPFPVLDPGEPSPK